MKVLYIPSVWIYSVASVVNFSAMFMSLKCLWLICIVYLGGGQVRGTTHFSDDFPTLNATQKASIFICLWKQQLKFWSIGK